MDPYLTKAEAHLRDGRAMLEGMRARSKDVKELDALFVEASRLFEQLRGATSGTADLKVALEKAMDAFRSAMVKHRS
jgi:hypothetical protein